MAKRPGSQPRTALPSPERLAQIEADYVHDFARYSKNLGGGYRIEYSPSNPRLPNYHNDNAFWKLHNLSTGTVGHLWAVSGFPVKLIEIQGYLPENSHPREFEAHFGEPFAHVLLRSLVGLVNKHYSFASPPHAPKLVICNPAVAIPMQYNPSRALSLVHDFCPPSSFKALKGSVERVAKQNDLSYADLIEIIETRKIPAGLPESLSQMGGFPKFVAGELFREVESLGDFRVKESLFAKARRKAAKE